MIDLGFTITDPNFVQGGWIPPDDRTSEEQRIHEQFVADTPVVREVFGGPEPVENKDRPRIWELTKLAVARGLVPPEYIRKGHLKNVNQLIGSCVGFGAGTMLLYSSMIDALIRNQAERIVLPFVPYHYGRGRLHSGIRGSGSGSTGSGQALALQRDGYLAHDSLDVPAVNFGETFRWTEKIETQWSDGARISDQYVTEAQNHLVSTVVRVTSTDEAAMLADSFHTFTIASNWGGKMQCPVKDGVLLNSRSGTWNHQMGVLDYIIHAILGRLWYVVNQWAYPHGVDPGGEWDHNTGAPEGGFYMLDKDLAYILGQRETYAFADPLGFRDLSREFDWSGLFGELANAESADPVHRSRRSPGGSRAQPRGRSA